MRLLRLVPIFILLAACGGKEKFSPEDNADMQLANQVTIFESKASQQQWILTAEAVDFGALQSATLKNPVLLLKQNNADSARISGDIGTFDYQKRLVSIEGNARIDALTEDAHLVTDRFFYDIDKNRVWSDHKTTITRQNAKSVARGGIETDSKLTKIEMKNHSTRLPTDARELRRK